VIPDSGNLKGSMEAPYVVQLVVPATAGSVRLARLVAASLAADAEWTLPDTDDLRVAVSELVALLLEGAEDGTDTLDLTYQRTDNTVEVSGQRALSTNPVEPHPATVDDLALEILRVVVDEHEFTQDPHKRWFRLLKRADKHP
jgi:hypothetical protein